MDDAEVALEAAQAGARVVRQHFGVSRTHELKGHNNPVTAADRAAEAAILSLLRRVRPADGVLGEEGSDVASAPGSTRRWIIDPLDGTVNFVHGIPHIAVSVALYRGDDPIVAAIVDPLREETFFAEAGRGATLNGTTISVAPTSELSGAVIATGFGYDRAERAADYTRPVTRILEVATGVRRAGSAALDFAWVAAGRYGGYFELDLEPWDLAGGILLVREAGGVVTDPFGTPSTPQIRLAVASNGAIHESLRTVVAAALPPRLTAGRV